MNESQLEERGMSQPWGERERERKTGDKAQVTKLIPVIVSPLSPEW